MHNNSITQPLHTVHTGHISATFSVSIYCVLAGLTSHRVLHCAVSILLALHTGTRNKGMGIGAPLWVQRRPLSIAFPRIAHSPSVKSLQLSSLGCFSNGRIASDANSLNVDTHRLDPAPFVPRVWAGQGYPGLAMGCKVSSLCGLQPQLSGKNQESRFSRASSREANSKSHLLEPPKVPPPHKARKTVNRSCKFDGSNASLDAHAPCRSPSGSLETTRSVFVGLHRNTGCMAALAVCSQVHSYMIFPLSASLS